MTGLILSTATLGLAACGGDDGLSRADYVKQVNGICRDGNAQLAKIPEPTTPAGLATYVADAKKITTAGVDKMDALEPPKDLRADHDAQVADGRKVIALADDLATAARAGDETKLQELSAKGDQMDEASDRRAERMGLTDCADDN
jgi:hypothetical protein